MAKGQIKQKQDRISQQQFESLCYIQCTQEEICSVLNVCHDTLDEWCKTTYDKKFSQVFTEKRQGGRASLRRNQWKLAEKNATMAIFLGKQYLNQKDVVEQQINDNGVMSDLLEAMQNVKKSE